MASTISAGTTSGTAIAIAGDTSGQLQLQTNGTTTAVTITTAQDVGIGTSSPNLSGAGKALTVNSTTGAIYELATAGTRTAYFYNDGTNTQVYSTTASGFLAFGTNNTTQAAITSAGLFQFNSGYGSVATAYGCRAWVNFNGTGTVAIRASGNVSSITDNGTGDYTINFTSALVDNNYCPQLTGMRDSDNNGSLNCTILKSTTYANTVTTTSLRVLAENDSGTRVDTPYYGAAIFR